MKRWSLIAKNKIDRIKHFLQTHPDKKRLIIILVILFLLPFTIGAALTVQNLRQKASGSDYVRILDASGNTISQTTDPNIFLQITLPSDWTLSSTSSRHSGKSDAMSDASRIDSRNSGQVRSWTSQDDGFAFSIPKAYAQSNGSTCLGITVNNGTPVSPGKPYPAVVSIQNGGNTDWTWDSPNPYKLGSQDPQDNLEWSLGRVDLPVSPIQPGQTATFRFNVWPPETPGKHSFNWQMLQEGIGWFGSRCYYNVTVVSQSTPTPQQLPTVTQEPTAFPSSTSIPTEQPTSTPAMQPSTTQSPTQPPYTFLKN